jgi:hypothetical protein
MIVQSKTKFLLCVPLSTGQGLECFDCDFQWLQFQVNGTVIENVSPVGGKRCATDPDTSYPLIEAKMCADGEVCISTYVSGTYDDPGEFEYKA